MNNFTDLTFDFNNTNSMASYGAECGNDLKCFYDSICGGLNDSLLWKGVYLIIIIFVLQWVLYWFIVNKSKYFKFKLNYSWLEYDFNDKFDRLRFAYNFKNYMIVAMAGYIGMVIFFMW